ncbi:hypothetical protein Goarm_021688, partial [Gossypium armourianum]|nr:hypothetical protein [Gossypium armourianum]
TETHNFYLPRDKCTIRIEDVALQLGLSIDRSVITRLAIVSGKKDLWATFLRKWLPTPIVVVGLVATTISTSPSERLIYVFIDDKEDNNIWDSRIEFLPILEPFISLDTEVWLEYMLWFKVADKPYLLSVEARTKKLCQERQRRMPQLCRSKQDAAMGSPLTPTQQMPSMSTPHPSQYIFQGTFIPNILHSHTDVDVDAITKPNTDDVPSPTSSSILLSMTRSIPTTASHSSIEECDGEDDKDGAEGGDKDDGVDKDEHEGRGEDKEDEDNGDDQMEESTPQVVHRNLARTH